LKKKNSSNAGDKHAAAETTKQFEKTSKNKDQILLLYEKQSCQNERIRDQIAKKVSR